MTGWFERLTSRNPKSASQAKERLKLVLINDRTDMTQQDMDRLKNELLAVISRYIDIDPSAVRIDMTQEGRQQRLVADIPIKAATNRRRTASP